MKNLVSRIEIMKEENKSLYYSIINNYLSIDEFEETLDLNHSISFYGEIDAEDSEEDILDDLIDDNFELRCLLEDLEK